MMINTVSKNTLDVAKISELNSNIILVCVQQRPSMPVDIQALIEESEERLTEEQVDEIIRIVDDCLPLNPELTKGEKQNQ